MTLFDCRDPQGRVEGVSAARHALADESLVVLPTDTVYGIAADAFRPVAVHALLLAKGRTRDMPVPVLVGSAGALDGLAERVPEVARRLVRAFWPGGLTLVLPQVPTLAWDLGEARGTVAVRMPAHPVAITLLEATGPLAVSSANLSGSPPAATAAEAEAAFGASVAVYLESGPLPSAVASTIVDLSTPGAYRVLRVGAVGVSELRAVAPDVQA